ncbi:hypothetical protein [Nostoc sp. JL33]|uniref:dCTP deaminase domain-containing protein n=1 Tax=Nostoc sp. JL33 TaxID=2815396 RepID=UPI0025D71BFE|nr:hypothetical protein [Nostoc sp. JL33]MBN3869514.1 hypothetical protein [Nostoc sp. JL33]
MTNPSQSNLQSNNPFSQDDADAERRFQIYRSNDVFPRIAPALLNSADIYDYVAATGMIYPFDPDKLKPASYEVNLLGKCVYWDEKGNKKVKYIDQGVDFTLKKNSIAFVTLEPTFRIPDYIALRFNLKITNIYKGLLLGTGPLVDPGFDGKLSIPLHNLTTNDYTFKGGDPLIWMEFTKLSPNKHWKPSNTKISPISRQGEYKPFPKAKNKNDVEGYLIKAYPGPIRSSIPDVIQNAQSSAEESSKSAKEAAEKAKSIEFRVTWGGLIAVIVSIIAVLAANWSIGQLFLNTYEYVYSTREKYGDQTQKIQSLEQEIQILNQRIKALENAEKGATQKSPTPQVFPTPTP